MSDIRTVVDGDVKVLVKKPTKKEFNDSQIVYNKAMREALENKAFLRGKLNSYLEEQGIWDKDKEAKYQKFISDINSKEMILKIEDGKKKKLCQKKNYFRCQKRKFRLQ